MGCVPIFYLCAFSKLRYGQQGACQQGAHHRLQIRAGIYASSQSPSNPPVNVIQAKWLRTEMPGCFAALKSSIAIKGGQGQPAKWWWCLLSGGIWVCTTYWKGIKGDNFFTSF